MLLCVVGLLSTTRVLAGQHPAAMPDAPALAYLGATSAKVTQPATPRDLATAIANGIDSLGRAQSGVAIDFTPWPLLPFRVTRRSYNSIPGFVYANTQLSIASTRSAGDTTSTDVAIGAKTNLVNRGDPLTDNAYRKSVDSILDDCLTSRGTPAARKSCADSAVADKYQSWETAHWNAVAWSIAGAFGARLRQSQFTSFVGRGGAIWSTLALPVSTRGQLLLQVRDDWIRGGTAADTNAVACGGRFSFGGKETKGFAELLGTRRNHARSSSSGHSWSGGIEHRVQAQIWLSAGFGSRYNDLVKGDRAVLMANLRWNIAEQSQLAP